VRFDTTKRFCNVLCHRIDSVASPMTFKPASPGKATIIIGEFF
jgi:hypothetical protein